jgi:hypothetical protein
MSRRNRRLCRLVILALAALAAMALPALASANVTVRVVGQSSELLAATSVALGEGGRDAVGWSGERMPQRCPNDTAYQAVELAVRGRWDRELLAVEVLGERHTFSPNEEYWVPYDLDVTSALWHYAEYGLCELRMPANSTILLQAGRSGAEPTYIPDAVPLELERVTPATGKILVGGRLILHARKWRPTDIFGREDGRGHFVIPLITSSDAAGYTVEGAGLGTSGRTDERGNVTLTLTRAGRFRIQASMPGSATDWSRSQFIDICVENGITVRC